MPTGTNLICEKLDYVHKANDNTSRRNVSRSLSRAVMEEWRQGGLTFMGDDSPVDVAAITYSFRKGNRRFADAYDAINADSTEYKDNRAAVHEAISLSQYGDFVSACTRMGSFELCASPDFAPVLSLFPRRFIDCVNRARYTMPALADFDPPCVTEDSRTKYFGLGDITKVQDPEPEEYRFGMQLKRNMVCVDPNGEFQSLIREQMANVMRMNALRQLLKQLTNVNCGADARDPNYDGIQYNPYLQCGPWCNLVYNQSGFDCSCQHAAILAVEAMAEDGRNPITGNPMQCCDNLDIMVFGQQQRRYFRELLGPHLSVRTPGGAECGTCEIPVQGRDGWGRVIYDKWLRKLFREFLCAEFAGDSITDAEVDQMVDRTVIAGCFSQAVEWQVRWDTEVTERSGIETSEYHRENIIYSAVISEWTGAAWNNPWAVYKVYGLPATLAGSAVTVPTACTDDHPMCGASETAG